SPPPPHLLSFPTRRSSDLTLRRGTFSVSSAPAMKVLRETQFAGLTLAARGKVRDIYDLGDKLLIVATDRLSAFDVILPTPIPDKDRKSTRLNSSHVAISYA